MRSNVPNFKRGFTLVETVMVIVITGIISAIVAVFIRTPVQGYLDSAARAELTDVADTALRRMARDLRLALPNSIRVNGQYIEFLLTSDGGRYLAEEDNPATGNILDFNNGGLMFDVVGQPMTGIAPGTNSIVVYNLGFDPANAYCPDNGVGCNNRAVVAGIATAAGVTTVTLKTNPFTMRSPNNRFQVVTTPVTYGCAGGTLTRFWGYPIAATQATPPAGAGVQSAVLATGVQNCTFSYASQANVRSGLVGLGITIGGASNNETVQLFHQVHVDNTP